jgi:Na+-transporting methylmalonyl-CoA/oxaloacetate decarboxylase gamma subunit
MPVDTLLTVAIELMVIGMGTVFIILGLLIGCMNVLYIFAPSEELVAASCDDDKSLIAAIQTAIHHYRNRSAHHSAT